MSPDATKSQSNLESWGQVACRCWSSSLPMLGVEQSDE